MQNSLDRLLVGMSRSLRETIAPAISDPYAQGQALACAELIENLAGQVQWQVAGQLDEIERIRPLLIRANELAPAAGAFEPVRRALADPVPDPADAEALRRCRNLHLAALGAVDGWSAAESDLDLRAAARGLVREFQEEESLRFARSRELARGEEKG